MLTIWGRASSSNVQKVLWTCEELGLPFERLDAGREFGQVDQDWYVQLNPNRLVPVLRDGELILWESNTIMRYLANRHGAGNPLYPTDPATRALAERWMDWQLSVLAPTIAPVFWAIVRPGPNPPDPAELAGHIEKLGRTWEMLERHLANQPYVAGDTLTLGDIVLGYAVRRWFWFDFAKPDLPNLAAWHKRLAARPGFQTHLMGPVV